MVDPNAVKCPTCGADPHQPCLRPRLSRGHTFHAERWDAADRGPQPRWGDDPTPTDQDYGLPADAPLTLE